MSLMYYKNMRQELRPSHKKEKNICWKKILNPIVVVEISKKVFSNHGLKTFKNIFEI